MTFEEWEAQRDEAFVTWFVAAQRDQAEKDARIQIERAGEWRRKVQAGEDMYIASFSDDPFKRKYPDHDYAHYYSGINLATVATFCSGYARTHPPPPLTQEGD